METEKKKWQVLFSKTAEKNYKKLPQKVRAALYLLAKEIEDEGPVRGNWSNYSKLEKNRHHCHLKKGRPTYVCVWEVKDRKIRIVSIEYAGTHEKAPY